MQTLEINDFSGGTTDYYNDAEPNKLKTLKNCILEIHGNRALPRQRPGVSVDPSYDIGGAAGQLPTGNQGIRLAFFHGGSNIFCGSSRKLYFSPYTLNAWVEVKYYDDTSAFSANVDANTRFTKSQDYFHTYINCSPSINVFESYRMFYTTTSDKAVTFPMYLPKKSCTLASAGAGANVWLYKFILRHTYTAKHIANADTAAFAVYGPASSALSVTGGLNVVLNMPVYAQPAQSYYGSFYLEVYRTTNSGSVFYKVGEQVTSSGASTFTDSVSDATLVGNEVLFTDAGEMNNYDASTTARQQCMHNGRAYVITGPTTIYQSKAEAPSMLGDTAYAITDAEVISVASTPNGVVALTTRGPYRIDGEFDDSGDGGMSLSRIGEIGPAYSKMAVTAGSGGVFWLDYANYCYFTDGFKTTCLNRHSVTASQMTPGTFEGAAFNTRGDKVYFLVGTTLIYVLDLKFGISETAVFYTWEYGGSQLIRTIAEYYNADSLVLGQNTGYWFYHTDSELSDPQVSTTVAFTSWDRSTILYEVETVGLDMGTAKARKYSPTMSVTLDRDNAVYRTAQEFDMCLALTADNDDGRRTSSLKPVLVANISAGVVTHKRHFPAQSLRYLKKRIKLSNAYVALYNSSAYSTCNINSTTKVATLTNTVTYDWPTNILGYYISFENDGFVRDYLITARTADTLTYSDAGNNSSTLSAQRWVIRGYPKGQFFKLLSLSIDYDVNGSGQDPFNTSDGKDLA